MNQKISVFKICYFDPTTQWYAQPKGKQGRNQTYFDAAILKL